MIDDLKAQWTRLRTAERAWLDNPNMATAQTYTDAFKAIRIGAVGELLAENERLRVSLNAYLSQEPALREALGLPMHGDELFSELVEDVIERLRVQEGTGE